MSKIITIANTKGGVGKTTTTIYLAVALALYGKVTILDADMQASATEWIENIDTQLPFEYEVANKRTFHKYRKSDFVLIDTPPHSLDIIKEAVSVSDLVIIPSKTTGLDLQRTLDTINILPDMKKYKVLLSMTLDKTTLLKETQKYLLDNNIPMFNETIPKRENIAKSVGYIPTALYGFDKIAKNIIETNIGETKWK